MYSLKINTTLDCPIPKFQGQISRPLEITTETHSGAVLRLFPVAVSGRDGCRILTWLCYLVLERTPLWVSYITCPLSLTVTQLRRNGLSFGNENLSNSKSSRDIWKMTSRFQISSKAHVRLLEWGGCWTLWVLHITIDVPHDPQTDLNNSE